MSRRAWVGLLSSLSCSCCHRWPARTTTAAGGRRSASDAREAGIARHRRPPTALGPTDPAPTLAPTAAVAMGPSEAPAALTEQQQRGKYLVENVIACPECHTPRLPNGQLDMSKYMAGDTDVLRGAPNNDCIYARNLTPHATGLGNRTRRRDQEDVHGGPATRRHRRGGPSPDHALLRVRQHGSRGRRRDRRLPEGASRPIANTIPLKGDVVRRARCPRRPSTWQRSPRRPTTTPTRRRRCAGATWPPRSACAWSATPHT